MAVAPPRQGSGRRISSTGEPNSMYGAAPSASGSGSGSAMGSMPGPTSPVDQGQRPVVRAACLNCRSAKRRCDGVAPVCGPCASRGIEDGGCNFVSSKRGGPRYKGVRGADAARVKAERDRLREKQHASTGKEDSGRRSYDPSSRTRSGTSQSDESSPNSTGHYHADASPSSPDTTYVGHSHYSPGRAHGRQWGNYAANGNAAGAVPYTFPQSKMPGSSRAHESYASAPSVMATSATFEQNHGTATSTAFGMPSQTHADLFPEQQLHHQLLEQQRQVQMAQQGPLMSQPQFAQQQHQQHTQQSQSSGPPHTQAQLAMDTNFPQQQQPQQHSASEHTVKSAPVAPNDALLGIDYNDILSFANLEVWQHLQERTSGTSIDDQNAQDFSAFFANLEVLPKAGIVASPNCTVPPTDPLDVIMDWEGGEIGGNVQDMEQGVRVLLSDFYALVYPSCPVLPSPGSLPSFAFYFSGKGPCGLFAAISAIVALHLPTSEAHKTLKASYHPLQRFEASPTVHNPETGDRGDLHTPGDIAAYHAKTSEFILHQWQEKQRTCFMDLSSNNPFEGLDEELITIEAGAAHTILCQYHYGSNKPLGHQRAYKHAVEAWNLMQRLDIPNRTLESSQERTNVVRPFAAELKLEWAKRVYWCSYTAATVMSCTGGFAPFGSPRDGAMDLNLRPTLDHDVSAWSVMVRGAQHVSKCYRLLFELDQLRVRMAERDTQMLPLEIHQVSVERQTIFNAMLKLDAEIGTYTRFDAGWRDVPQSAINLNVPSTGGLKRSQDAVVGGPLQLNSNDIQPADRDLARSLKVAGRLMTSGAIILLHRAQAFSNARVFIKPQCGVPQANRAGRTRCAEPLIYRASATTLSFGDGNQTGASPPSRNGSSMTSHSTESHSSGSSSTGGSQDPSFLMDRFAGGPFEPPHSLERCRFAASTMVSTLPRVLQDPSHSPKLPPYSACSYVLGAYAILMLALLAQVRSEISAQQKQQHQHANQSREAANGASAGAQPKHERAPMSSTQASQLELQRTSVRDVIKTLSKFAVVWPKAVEYAKEVSTLLQANEILG